MTPRMLFAAVVALACAGIGASGGQNPNTCAIPDDEPSTPAEAKVACSSLVDCMHDLALAAQPGPGISRHEQDVSEAVRAFGPSAVPELLRLLSHQDPEVRDLASYTLRDAVGLNEEHLDALIAARLNGSGWIPPAVARVGSPRAIEFLVSELEKEPEKHTQLTWAFELLGEKGVPYLVEPFECDQACAEPVLEVIAQIFSELGEQAAGAVDRLVAVAGDPHRHLVARRGAIRALGGLGAAAWPTTATLETIRADEPDALGRAVNEALMKMGGPGATEARRLEGEALERCSTEGTPEQSGAAAALESLHERIRSLSPSADLGPAVDELHSLLRSRCFRLSVEQGAPPSFDHVLALQSWWEEGGLAWVSSYIRRPQLGRVDDLRANVVFPPQARRVLTLDTAPTHPLSALLCPTSGDECGSETEGWQERARQVFASHVLEEHQWRPDAFPVHREAIATRCEAEVRDELGIDYLRWMECLQEHRPVDWALPLGRFRSPRTGWLVIRGRRGHYDFCDEVRAYDLETGAAYVAQSCSSLHLQTGGHVDFKQTDATRKTTVSGGKVDVANLREAVWMILLAAEAEETHLHADYFPLPPGVTPYLRADEDIYGRIMGGRIFGSSAQTRLAWSWRTSSGRTLASGGLTWPASYSAAETHAAHLLDIAEKSFVRGCVPAPLPVLGSPGASPGVSRRDARAEDLTALQLELGDGLARGAAITPCEGSPGE